MSVMKHLQQGISNPKFYGLVGWLIDSSRPGKQFLSHVGTEPPLPGYCQYFWGVNVPCSRTQHGLTRVGLEPPTSGSGVKFYGDLVYRFKEIIRNH